MIGVELSRGAMRAYKASLRRDPCAYCGAPAEEIDHIVSRADGGPDDWTNWVGLCRDCNISKGGKSLLAFMAYRVFRFREIKDEMSRLAGLWARVGRRTGNAWRQAA